MGHKKKVFILFLVWSQIIFAQVREAELVRIDGEELQSYRGRSGKWVILSNYRESIQELLREFGSSRREFKKINDIHSLRVSQNVPYFIPYSEEYARQLVANGKGRKLVKTDPRDFVLPVNPRFYNITSRMGRRWNIMHSGLDIACPSGSPVIAAADGEVKTSTFLGNYGYAIVLQHNQLNHIQTVYGHNSVLFVKEGEKVKKGQVIALSGNTGHSTGPHLHFEVRYNRVVLNPEHYLGAMLNSETSVVLTESPNSTEIP